MARPTTPLSPGARLYVGGVILLGTALLVACFPTDGFRDPTLFVILLVLSALTSTFKVNLPLARSGSTMSVSYAVDFASLLLLGPHETMLVAAASAWSQCTFRMKERNLLHRTLFSMAVLVVAVQAAGAVYGYFGGVTGQLAPATVAGPLLAAALAYFVVNTVAIAGAIAFSTSQTGLRVWNDHFLWSAPSYFVGAGAAAVSALIIDHSGFWLIPLAAAPLYLTFRTYKVYLGRIEDEQRHVQEISDLHLAAIEALALAIDAKDQMAQSHIRRVQVYAAGLARALGMPEHEVQGVKTAALLHDIGKLAVPEHILSKPGPLTEEEFNKVRAHPNVGAEIISHVPFPYPVAPLIHSHHERWDGTGYPDGLAGEDIPLGARILTVVDYFDALCSDRPYHKAMDAEAALSILRRESGSALDPTIVDTFIELLPSLSREAARSENLVRKLSSVGSTAETSPKIAPARVHRREGEVFEDIARAHKEVYALYEMAQAMGTSLGVSDTMAIISAKLSNLVPFSCCALFLIDEASDTLRCQFASGTDADVVQQVIVDSGAGLAGWVARHRTSLLNGRPSADLEAAGLSSASTTLRAALVAPLTTRDRFIGTLTVYHETEGFYTQDHQRLLESVSEQAASVVSNSLVFEQTQEDSLTDVLTGLPNTRFLFMHLTRELARAERLKSQVALLVMDLDDFKQINDGHGHHVGDRALCEVAQVLRAAIRPYDVCVRYAGDEFILVLAGCNREEAELKRADLQSAVAQMFFEARPGKRVELGASLGAAVFPEDGSVYEALLAAADARMYRDKSLRKQRRSTAAARPPGTRPTPELAVDYAKPRRTSSGSARLAPPVQP